MAVLETVSGAVGRILQKVFGSRNERLVRAYRMRVEEVAALEAELGDISDDALPQETEKLRERLRGGETVDDILPMAFALVRTASERTVNMRPFDVQLIGGQVLIEGKIAEMVTGEGKTLVAVVANYLQALVGAVHLVTTNDFLVRYHATWMGPIYEKLGLTVGYIQSSMSPAERIPQYRCDITYGTNNEFGFDYLRDNMKTSAAEQVQKNLDYVIVDEVDSVLIDEARTPLIISGPAFESTQQYALADTVARQLKADVDFEIKEKEHQTPMTERGIKHAEQLVGVGSFYIAGNMHWPHLLEQSLRAHYLYHKDKNYVVQNDEVIIVDEFTGRLMPGRQWSDGLHQAVEAKERIRIKEETQTLATITFQNFFKLYKRLAGMTGTAMSEAEEFEKIYGLETVAIPTNRPLNRVEHPDVVYMTLREKYDALVEEVNEYSKRGRPVLVGTVSIENSELISNMLTKRHGVQHQVLNAKFHEKESEIVADAGQRHTDRSGHVCGNVTIATNMAGRGTDIKLGEGVVNPDCYGPWDVAHQDRPSDFGNKCCINCPEYDGVCAHCFKPKKDPSFPKRGRTECRENPPCGLHIVGTERHESRRIDNQLRGRAGRQGDPGSSRFFLSLEDDLMRIFAKDWVTGLLKRMGMQEGMSLEHGFLSRGIENAQKKVEEHNFSIRKNLLEYDEVMDQQRKVFYGQRQRVLETGNLRPVVEEHLQRSVDRALERMLSPLYPYEAIVEWSRRTLEVAVKPKQLDGRTAEEIGEIIKERAADQARDRVSEQLGEFYLLDDDGGDEASDDAPAAEPKLDERAVVEWAKERFGLTISRQEVREMSADELQERLEEAAAAKVSEADISALADFTAADYPARSLADWLQRSMGLEIAVAELHDVPRDEIERKLHEKMGEMYDQRERQYPVDHAIEECLNPKVGAGAFDFGGLAEWASWYYQTPVGVDDVKQETLGETRDRLLEISDRSEREGALRAAIHKGLSRYLSSDEATLRENNVPAVRKWAAEHLRIELTSEELAGGNREGLANLLEERFRAERRRVMNDLERYLLLQVHDTSWKDHLYAMDHLKSGVGLRGYAQVDPKVEYKREGLRLFQQMLEMIDGKFTDLFFKARWVQREALNRIWSGQSAEHEEMAAGMAQFDRQREAAIEGSKETAEKPKPIVRSTARVGRNDPCPCGSGKKYKKCCGRPK